MVQSNRAIDSKQENIVNAFIDKYFFKKIFKNSSIINDRELQVNGVDIIADGKNYDLKAQSSPRYLNNPTDTFIVEISFLNKVGNRVDGWFLKDTITDDYVFIWLPKVNVGDDGYIHSVEDIEEAEIIIADKESLYDAVIKTLGDKSFWDIEDELISLNEHATARPFRYINDIKYVMSTQLYEMPICAVLPKSFIKKCAVGHYHVTKQSIITAV